MVRRHVLHGSYLAAVLYACGFVVETLIVDYYEA